MRHHRRTYREHFDPAVEAWRVLLAAFVFAVWSLVYCSLFGW